MKLLRLPDSFHSEFEAESAEKAIEIAREKLGGSAELRCWKVRHGGLFGFFARESFVAGPQVPDGKGGDFQGNASAGLDANSSFAFRCETDHQAHLREEGEGEYSQSLSQLAELTSDELDIGSASIPSLAFTDLLAEAEAEIEKAAKASRVVEHVKPAKKNKPIHPEIDFFDKLRTLGVGHQHLSWASPHSLDAALEAFQLLPKVPKIPSSPGSVVVIAGSKEDVRLGGETAAKNLGVSPSEVIQMESLDSMVQKVSRRRRSKKISIVLCEAPVSQDNFELARELFHKVRPDYVLGSVPASAKCSDVLQWSSRLGNLDAIALHSLDATATPGEMLGELPIAFLEGRPATSLLWLVMLLGRSEGN